MNLKKYIFILVLFPLSGVLHAQGLGSSQYFADEKFHSASDEYIEGSLEQALTTVNQGLERVPDHKKLLELKKLLEQEQQEQEQNQDQQQDQQNQDQQQQQQQQQQDQENQEQQEQQEQQQQEQQEQENQEQQEQEQENQESEEPSEEDLKKEIAQKLEEMNMSEEKARMILEAMKNSEQQYLQQLRRKATKKKTGKPDW